MATRIFAIIDNVSATTVKNPAPLCQCMTAHTFYQEQAESFLNDYGDRDFTIYELIPISTKRAIV